MQNLRRILFIKKTLTMQDYGIDQYQRNLLRVCKECGRQYTIRQFLEGAESYFARPHNFRAGCEEYCLDCWLCVGPHDLHEQDDSKITDNAASSSDAAISIESMDAGVNEDTW